MKASSKIGKIIRIDTKSSRSTSGVRLLNLDTDDKVASATVIPRRPQGQWPRRHPATVRSQVVECASKHVGGSNVQ